VHDAELQVRIVALENSDAQEWVPRHSNGGQISCNQMRAKINAFLASGDMTRTKWVEAISVQYDAAATPPLPP
jgi:hypothetical protein